MSSDGERESLTATARIAAAWERAPAPTIAESIGLVGLDDEQSAADALTLDAEHRRQNSMPARLEHYLSECPSLGQQQAVCRALLMVEAVERAQEPIEAIRSQWHARFPDQAECIEQVLSLCALLHDMTPEQLPPAREPGTRLGKYVLEWRLGAGAFGEAWQAFDTTLERHVALKILRQSPEDKDTGLQQVLAEARAAAALDHPAIVRVHEAGQFPQTGEGFIDSQLIGPVRTSHEPVQHSRTLEDRLRSGAMSPRDAALLVAQVARGVAVAHARGITHRDIKPANILLGTDGRPLLADFGLSETQSLRGDAALTAPRRIAGTPAYMAPEVARREGATPLSDVYSLGATLRALLTGRPPIDVSIPGSDQARAAVLTLVRTQPLGPLLGVAPRTPQTLARICDTATAFAPDARYGSADRLAADLEAFLSHRPTSVHPVGLAGGAWLWHQRNRLAGTVLLAAAIALGAGTIGFVARLKVERDRALLAQVEASRQRDAAVAAREVVETMNQFIARTFNSIRGLKGKAEFTMADAIGLAADRAGLTFSDRPLVEASVRHFLGQAAIGAGDFVLAGRQLDRAVALRRDLLGPTHRDTVATMRQQAELLAADGKPAAALVLFEQVAALLNEPAGNESPDTLRALTALAGKAVREKRTDDALDLLDRVVAGYRRLKYNVGADHQAALNIVVSVCVERGEMARAISSQKEIVALNVASLGEDDISTLNAAQALGWVYRKAGDPGLAVASYRDVLPRFERLVGLTHVGTMHTTIELSTLLAESDPNEALLLARRVWSSAGTLSPSSQYFLRAQLALGRALVASRQLQEAREVLKQAVENCTKHRGADHVYTVDARALLSQLETPAQPTGGAAASENPPRR